MREIPLTQGQVAFVDDEDYEYLTRAPFKWRASKGGEDGYPVSWFGVGDVELATVVNQPDNVTDARWSWHTVLQPEYGIETRNEYCATFYGARYEAETYVRECLAG